MKQTYYSQKALNRARDLAESMRHEYITPEHLLGGMLVQQGFMMALEDVGGDAEELSVALYDYLDHEMEPVPEGMDYELEVSVQTTQLIQMACLMAEHADQDTIDIPHLVQGLMALEDSQANYLLQRCINGQKTDFLSELVTEYAAIKDLKVPDAAPEGDYSDEETPETEPWRRMVVCLNDLVEQHNPLIGREEEMERTIRVLCRKDKNNPLHVGEPGVGKTALAYGLAARIESGQVPERLIGNRIYELDLGGMVAGTQYRGEFEKRLKNVMEGLRKEGNAIVYIDEFHNLVGAGSSNEGSLDASNLLKPYMETGEIRFMGATTYEEYNRYLAKSKGLMRRFQQIDIAEPSVEEATAIVEGLKKRYEEFHGVTYDEGVVAYAVQTSARFINDRFLPDKAIDLIDEAGAYREMHPAADGSHRVDRELIQEILARICKVDNLTVQEEGAEELMHLPERMAQRIFGQQEAVQAVAEAVQLAKAGLTDENKPIASLLFVGPTGVGKTEVARVLADELHLPLVRFDMSEYTEKHTVAKLIGSPAGYVGYDDGGLLTDAIRKTPNCVLLLDEIEKAHPDIFNILLQVMDYAVLTDNKGRKSDCRHLILLMTSNAGAQYAHQASVGFGRVVEAGEAMMKQVKRTFKPEFLNRLSGTIIFHDMNEEMAHSILNKKLGELNTKLKGKSVEMTVTDAAHGWLLSQSMTREYGAREMDRVIGRHLKPLLMRALISGKLKAGSTAVIELTEGALQLSVKEPQPEKEKKQRKAKSKPAEETLQPTQAIKAPTSRKQSSNKEGTQLPAQTTEAQTSSKKMEIQSKEKTASPDKKKETASKQKKQNKKSKQE